MPNKILIADNSSEDSDLAQRALANLHSVFEFAENIQDARVRAKEFEPAVILLDVHLPLREGEGDADFDDVLKFVEEFAEKSCVVILTGQVNSDDLDRAMERGARNYLDKGVLHNRSVFEALIKDAYSLHLAIVQKKDNAAMLAMQTQMAAQLSIIKLQLKRAAENTGALVEQKSELQKVQSYKQGETDGYDKAMREVRNKRRAFIVGWTITFISWAKYIFQAWQEHKK